MIRKIKIFIRKSVRIALLQISFVLFPVVFSSNTIFAQSSANNTDSTYIFSYFKNNGEDGLHLAYSNDGFSWNALFNDSSVLKPGVSKDRLMRDPCVIRGKDGRFH